jgi:outer membrane biosynthesis protein TonB
MMATEPEGVDRMSPETLVAGFSRSKILLCLLIAVGAHIFVISATSVPYIRDRWIDPEGAARRKEEREKAKRAEEEKAEATSEEAEPTTKTPAEAGKAPTTATAAADKKGKEDDSRKKAPVLKEITELPKKSEIPKQPDDLGISIEETNK